MFAHIFCKWLCVVLLITIIGCSQKTPVTTTPAATTTAQENAATSGGDGSAILSTVRLSPSADEQYQVKLLEALTQLADKRYVEALAALQSAQASKDTDEVKQLISKVQGLQLEQSSFERTVEDIQAVLDQEQGEQAAQLITQAFSQYGDGPQAEKIASLQRQADALLAVQKPDAVAQISRYRQQAEAAVKDNNLRAALLNYEQAIAVRADAALQQHADTLRNKLAKYDAALERAAVLRRDAATMEDAVAAYQEACQIWDTAQARQELADAQLALQHRRERVAVATFEVRGDDQLVPYGLAFAEELLPAFKGRYDLVERSQINRILDELKVTSDDLLASDQGRTDVGKFAKARYLVVGSITPLSGITVHARLIDLQTGLIVQTAKLVAVTPDEASKRLKELAAQLMMSDDEKLAYEQQYSQASAPTVASNNVMVTSSLPSYQANNLPAPMTYSTNKPPAWGTIQVEDYDRLPPMTTGTPLAPPVFVEQERPLRNRLLAVQIELGDYFFRRGRPQDALVRYQLARELEPGNLDILGRISLCQQYLPPVPVVIGPALVRRERIAFINFFVSGDPRQVPPELGTWTPGNLAPYFAVAYDVVDRDEVFWMMGRLGLNVSDVLRDAAVRRWLGRALGVRYLVVGRIQQVNSFSVTVSMLDTEQGWETGRAQVVVNNVHELKLRLPELARYTMVSATERSRLEQEAARLEDEYLRAQEAYRRGQFALALQISTSLKKQQPFNIRFGFLLNDSQDHVRLSAMEQARLQELDRQRGLAELTARRQAELTMAAERARQEALQRAAQMSAAERQRLRDQAQRQLLSQARIAIQGKNFSLAFQLFDGAAAFRPQDEALRREAAQARASYETDRLRLVTSWETQQEEARRRQRELEFSNSRQQWANERQRFQQLQLSNQNQQRQQDLAEYTRLLDQAQRLKAQGRFDQAAAALQAARRLNATEEVNRLLTDALVEQARAEAKAQDAGRLAELDRRLAQETARRKQAEELARTNWALYQTALQQAQDAYRNKNYAVALARYQDAGKLFNTDVVTQGMVSVQTAQAQERERLTAVKQMEEAKVRRGAEVATLLAISKTAEQAKKWDDALTALRQAQRLDSTHLEVIAGLTRVEGLKVKALEQANSQRDQTARVQSYLAQAQGRLKAKQFDAALALLDAAQKLAPTDKQVLAQMSEAKRLQALDAEALVAGKKMQEEARRLAALKIEEEEKAKKQADQARQQAEAALAANDWKAAEQALKTARQLAPSDPRLNKLGQQLAQGQSQASRQRTQVEAQSKLEAEAQARLAAMNQKQQGQVGEILKQAQAAIVKKDFTTAEKHLGDALALDSTNLAVGRVQRELQAARQADAQAKAAMSTADRKKLEEETAKKKVEFAKLMKEGKEALASEDFEKATKLFTAAKALNPEDADAALFLGMARRDIDRAKAAEELAKKEVEAQKKQAMEVAKAEANNKKKTEEELRLKLQMDENAKKRADILKELSKNQFNDYVAKGKQSLNSKKYDDAIAAFDKAAQLLPSEKEASQQLELAKKLKAEAAKMPEKQPEKKTLNVAQTLATASALQRQQKWAEALQLYQQVLAQNPNDRTAKAGATTCEFQVNFDAGKAALVKKDKDAAIKALEAALKLAPGHVETQKLLKQAKELR